NIDNGILIFAGPSRNFIQGNYIGTDVTGTAPLANTANGVFVLNSSSNTIGGAVAGQGNLISGNKRSGVLIYYGGNLNSTDNRVWGNRIGVDQSGTSALANGYDGVELNAVGGNIVGGVGSQRNIIAGNLDDGVRIFSYGPVTQGNTIQGNLIGN